MPFFYLISHSSRAMMVNLLNFWAALHSVPAVARVVGDTKEPPISDAQAQEPPHFI